MDMDPELLLKLLKTEFGKLDLPQCSLDKVIAATDVFFQKNLLHPIPRIKFKGYGNLYEALPDELRVKVLDYVVLGGASDIFSQPLGYHKDLLNRLNNLSQVFRKDEVILSKLNSIPSIYISAGAQDDDWYVDDCIKDIEILENPNKVFKYQPEGVDIITHESCNELKLMKILTKIFKKEPKLRNARKLDFSTSRFSFDIPFDKSLIFENVEIISNFHPRNMNYIQNLENFPNLKSLWVAKSLVRNVKDLAYLTKLSFLAVQDSHLTMIPLAINKLLSLKIINMSNNHISKIQNLSNLKKLEYLQLSGNQIKVIENLNNNKNLKYLFLGDNNAIEEIQNLTNLKKLKALDLSSTSVSKIQNLYNQSQLEVLDLRRTQIRKLENLNKLTNLQCLQLSNTFISKLENLECLQNLQSLHLIDCSSGRCFQKLENLDNLKSLNLLEISPCPGVTSLKGLSKLENLTVLNLSVHSITEIKDLGNLKKLKVLHLPIGAIENIGELKTYKSLADIDIMFNRVAKLGDLSSLSNLERCEMMQNPISRFKYKDLKSFFKAIENLRCEVLYTEFLRILRQVPGMSNYLEKYFPINGHEESLHNQEDDLSSLFHNMMFHSS